MKSQDSEVEEEDDDCMQGDVGEELAAHNGNADLQNISSSDKFGNSNINQSQNIPPLQLHRVQKPEFINHNHEPFSPGD